MPKAHRDPPPGRLRSNTRGRRETKATRTSMTTFQRRSALGSGRLVASRIFVTRENSARAWRSLQKLTIIVGATEGMHGHVGRSSANGRSADPHVGGS